MPTTRIDATYEVTTPMFCGGANGKNAELRLPSFKGVLRYWWRALAWSTYNGELTVILKEENTLFGSAGSGQSRVSMRLASPPTPEIRRAGEVFTVGDGARYLGYGVQLTRNCLSHGFDFTVQMRLSAGGNEQLDLLESAVICVGIFGGLGAKSRKGYGSVAIRSLTVGGKSRTIPCSIDKLHDTIAGFRRRHASGRGPGYTALSQDTRHLRVASEKQEPVELLDLLGRELMRFRVWGQRGRASPLFIHVHECKEGPVAVLSFLPSTPPPEGYRHRGRGAAAQQQREDKLYLPINRFLDRLLKCKAPLTAEEVLP